MFDLGISTNEFSVDENLGIVFIDSLPSYEDLEEICKNLYRELYFEKFDKFQREFVDGFDLYINALATAEYIEKHGQDELISELVGTEGFISTVKDIIVRFAKWLYDKISKLIQWISSLFSESSLSDKSKNPKQAGMKASVALVRGNKSDREKIKSELKKIAQKSKKKSSHSSEAIQEGCTTKTGLSADDYRRGIAIPSFIDRREINNKLEQLIGSLKQNYYNEKEEGISTGLIYDHIKSIENLLNSQKVRVDASDAAEYVIALSDQANVIRIYMIQLRDRLKRIKPLRENSSERECEEYIKAIEKEFNIKVNIVRKGDQSDRYKQLKDLVAGTFDVFRTCYRIELKIIEHIKPIVISLYGVGHNGSDKNRYNFISGAVDVRVKIPGSLMNRIQEAWHCKELKVNRLVISSTRASTNIDGTRGETRSIMNRYGREITGKDVFIAYTAFKNSVWYKEDEDSYKERLKNQNIDPSKYWIKLDMDRVEHFLRTVVHECRHLYQFLKNEHTKDLNKQAHSHKEYLEFDHEMDARKAAYNFKFEQSDKDWVEKILNLCIKKEYKVLNDYWGIN